MCPSFGFISPIRHLVHVLKITLQLIANAGKEGQSEDLLRNLFLTPEKENKMVIMQMHTALMSIQRRTTLFHEFLPNSKSKYLGWPRRRLLSYWCHWKAFQNYLGIVSDSWAWGAKPCSHQSQQKISHLYSSSWDFAQDLCEPKITPPSAIETGKD